ncbi:MAG: hypothetical protein AAGI90_01055 [Chlamydiota bacterium]
MVSAIQQAQLQEQDRSLAETGNTPNRLKDQIASVCLVCKNIAPICLGAIQLFSKEKRSLQAISIFGGAWTSYLGAYWFLEAIGNERSLTKNKDLLARIKVVVGFSLGLAGITSVGGTFANMTQASRAERILGNITKGLFFASSTCALTQAARYFAQEFSLFRDRYYLDEEAGEIRRLMHVLFFLRKELQETSFVDEEKAFTSRESLSRYGTFTEEIGATTHRTLSPTLLARYQEEPIFPLIEGLQQGDEVSREKAASIEQAIFQDHRQTVTVHIALILAALVSLASIVIASEGKESARITGFINILSGLLWLIVDSGVIPKIFACFREKEPIIDILFVENMPEENSAMIDIT